MAGEAAANLADAEDIADGVADALLVGAVERYGSISGEIYR